MAFLTHTNQTILPSSFTVAFLSFLLYHYISLQKWTSRTSGNIYYDFDVILRMILFKVCLYFLWYGIIYLMVIVKYILVSAI